MHEPFIIQLDLHINTYMKYSEISEILNTSEGALKASYHIAVKKISDFFHKSE